MDALIILFPSLAGYVFLHRSNFFKSWIRGASGYHIAFSSALSGIILVLITFLSLEFVEFVLCNLPREEWVQLLEKLPILDVDLPILDADASQASTRTEAHNLYFNVKFLLIQPLITSFISAAICNIFYTKRKGERRAAEGNVVLELADRVNTAIDYVEVAVRGGRVFIGRLVEVPPPHSQLAESCLGVVLVISGHLTERDGTWELTTDYRKMWPVPRGDSESKKDTESDPEWWKPLKVTVPMSEVRWVRAADPLPDAVRMFDSTGRQVDKAAARQSTERQENP